jgi:predicted secreted Zn-dependent protease
MNRALPWLSWALLLPWAGSAQNTLIWTTNYYPVSGTTLSEVQQSLRHSRPWKDKSNVDGLTDWHINWEFNVAPTADGCRCRSFITRTTITITLPRWSPSTNTPAPFQRAWDRYVTALGQHEAGHAQMALGAVAEQHKRIKELGPASDCDALKKSIDDLARRIVEDYTKRDAEYDRRTGHGATQGAVLFGRGRPELPKRE